jgi:TonB family protein
MKKLLILFCLSLSLVQGQDSLMFDYAFRATDNANYYYYKGVASKISNTLYEVNGKSKNGKTSFCSHYSDSALTVRNGKFTEIDSNYVWHYYFENGLREGDDKKYTINGDLISKEKFEKGVHVGVDSFFNAKGQLELTSDLNYKTYNGVIRQFNDEGKIIKKCEIKNGLYVCGECGCDSISDGRVIWAIGAKYKENLENAVARNFSVDYGQIRPGKYEVHVQFQVSEKGKVEAIKIWKRSGVNKVDVAAIEAVSRLKKFRPAIQNGKPVTFTIIVPLIFNLE